VDHRFGAVEPMIHDAGADDRRQSWSVGQIGQYKSHTALARRWYNGE
jgi:hypothetical protein